MADPRPLWEVMAEACAEHPDGIVDLKPGAIAAEIRAVRDWILLLPNGYDWRRMQAEALARVLTAEADRAERGETINPSESD